MPILEASRSSSLPTPRASFLDDRGRLDLDLGGGFDEAVHFDQRHGRIVRAHDLPPHSPDLVALAQIFVAADHVAGHLDDVLRPGSILSQDLERIHECLGELPVEREIGEALILVPADDAGSKDHPTAGADPVGIALRARPSWRLENLHGVTPPEAESRNMSRAMIWRCTSLAPS